MKQLTLSLTYVGETNVSFHEIVKATSLIELLSKFQLTIIKLTEQIKDEELQQLKLITEDDDIPF